MLKRTEFEVLYKKVKEGTATRQDEEKLDAYKVDNAIIMAAGYSARCMPLSNVMPKGLFRVKGEILIEREIGQLIDAGIEEIVVVTGFQSEKFEYLKEKYNIILVNNEDYDKYNNISSLYAAQKYMKNSYILCSDNYYEKNVFEQYVYDSYYSCIYSKAYCDEYCVTDVDAEGYIMGIHRGGAQSWYTIGDAFFNRSFSLKFVELMNQEWENEQVRKMLMDDFQLMHIDELKMLKVEREAGSIYEFDTLNEIKEFDGNFETFIYENLDRQNEVIRVFSKYSEVKPYHSVPTEQISGRLHLNENLFYPSPRCLEALERVTIEDLAFYDLHYQDDLVNVLASDLNMSANNIFIHNGSAEVIKSIFSILLNENDTILIPAPGWSYYKSVADAKFAQSISYGVIEGERSYRYDLDDLLRKAEQHHPRVIVLTTPHMPTGCSISTNDIEKVVMQNANSIILLDEAYWGYGDYSNDFERAIISQYSNVVISRTFSKFYGLANIRIGYGLCSYPLRKAIGVDLPLFRACGISRKIAMEAIKDREYYAAMREETNEVRNWFIEELNTMEGVRAFETEANFVFVRIDAADPEKIKAFMEENNILIRLFTDKDATRVRITIGPRDIMQRVLFQLEKALKM